MQYSFAFVLALGALILQCQARPQQLPSGDVTSTASPDSPPAESVNTDAESVTEVTGAAGEQPVFDEGEPAVGASNDDADPDADTPTTMTSMPEEESQQDEVTTTPTCAGDDCSSAVVAEDASSTDDAPAAPSEDDATEVITTTGQPPKSS